MNNTPNKKSVLMTQIRIKNFKCFADAIIPLRKLTLIYGQNSSGKSTIFHAITLFRLIIAQLNKKERLHAVKDKDHKISEEQIEMDAWKRIPWLRGGIASVQRDNNDPITIGHTLKLEGEGTEGNTYITSDISVGSNWDYSGKRGSSLPDKIVFGFKYGKLDAIRDQDNKDLDLIITINNYLPGNKVGAAKRQSANIQVSTTLLNWFCKEYTPKNEQIFRDYFKFPLDWGEAPFFKIIKNVPQYPKNDQTFLKAFKWVNESLKGAWENIEDHLKPESVIETCSGHIPAGDQYIGHDIQNTNFVFHLKNDFDDLLKNEVVISKANDALDLLDIPHRLNSTKGILDHRWQKSDQGNNLPQVGYGIQYLVPRLLLIFGEQHPLCMIEEPEAHVHPRLQAKLGSLFFKQTLSNDMTRQLIIESHSENLVLQIKREIHDIARENAETAKKWSDNILAIYVDYSQDNVTPKIEDHEEKSLAPVEITPRISYIRIDGDGNFMDYWPKGFFPERQENLYY